MADRCNPVSNRVIYEHAGAGSVTHVVQRTRLLCRRLVSPAPALAFVQNGRKIIRRHGVETEARAGDFLLIPNGADFDLINEPDENAVYEALVLYLSPDLIRDFSDDTAAVVHRASVLNDPPPAWCDAFHNAVDAIRSGHSLPDRVVASRVTEILLWLGSLGHKFAYLAPGPVERVRHIIGSDPARAWRGPELANILGMSEANFRRRLAAAETNFSELLVDVRMTVALTLLQSTDRSITDIALDVGYDSASRFAARFRARFEFSPREIRTNLRNFDQNGAKHDRDGAVLPPAE